MKVEKKTKVLFIAPKLGVFLGGQAIQADRIMRNLNKEPNLQVDLQSIGPRFFPRLQRVVGLRTLLRETKYLYDIVLKIPRYDIIHIFSAAHFSFLLTPVPAILLARLFGKKILLNYRSGQIKRHFKNWGWMLKPLLRLVDKIVVPSGYLVDKFAGYGFEAEPIYNFIDTNKFTFRERKPLRPVFLSNRLLEELYNIPCILKAFAIIQGKYPEAELVVASFGDKRDSLEKLAAELNLKNVEFVGKLENDGMIELYNEIDIYLNSPNTDNMPSSLIECYASGVPIVSTKAGGIPYILEHNKTGLMFKINDHEAMAREAIRLLEDENLVKRLTANGREYGKRFSWREVRKSWLQVYDGLLDESGLAHD